MDMPLSPYRLAKARRLYDAFNAFNAFSFTLLSGNVITLYALRLGASSTTIGILNAFVFTAFFFMPVGKYLVGHFSIINIFATAWIARYLVMIPLLFAPLAASHQRTDIALTLMLISVFLFHASRGVGMIGNNPVLNELASGSDRGAYMTQVQVINSAVSMCASLALALLLGRNPPLTLYGILMAIGISSGVAGSLFLYKIPEPPESEEGRRSTFISTTLETLRQPSFKLFIAIFFIVSFVSSIARTFTVVYSREAYLQGDGMVALFTVFGSLGALAMGLFTRLLVDRVGSKPLYIAYTVVAGFSLVPVLISPSFLSLSIIPVIVFLSALHFSINFGFAGAEGVAQTYFFALVRPKDLLNLGILYYFVFGLGGAAGSFLGGLSLDLLSTAGFSTFVSYRILFSVLFALLALALLLQRSLVRLGALPLRGALSVIFSFRDLRAITLLDRLDKSRSSKEDEKLLVALHDLPSNVSLSRLLERARSPRLAVRLEALWAIEVLEKLSPEAIQALLEDTEQNAYTTAYVSARILGKRGAFSALPILRKTLYSDDYLLAGESMVALARLGDEESRTNIEERVASTHNPRLRIMGVSALELFGNSASISVLLDLMRVENPAPYLRDEATLALSSLLGVQDQFYPMLVKYLEDPSLAQVLALDAVDAAIEKLGSVRRGAGKEDKKLRAKNLRNSIGLLVEKGDGSELARWIYASPKQSDEKSDSGYIPSLLAEASCDDDLVMHERFRLLLSCWSVRHLKLERNI